MVGNDIIDIQLSKQIGWERPGFMQKVFTKNEQLIIAASNDPFIAIWQLWSMKESAYKVFIQAGGKRFYNPTKIECSLEGSINGNVKVGELHLKTTTTIQEKYIFTTALVNKAKINTQIHQLPEGSSNLQSSFMHQQVIMDYARTNNLRTSGLSIKKTQQGVPKLHYRKKLLKNSFSISHHGKFGAFTFLVD